MDMGTPPPAGGQASEQEFNAPDLRPFVVAL